MLGLILRGENRVKVGVWGRERKGREGKDFGGGKEGKRERRDTQNFVCVDFFL